MSRHYVQFKGWVITEDKYYESGLDAEHEVEDLLYTKLKDLTFIEEFKVEGFDGQEASE